MGKGLAATLCLALAVVPASAADVIRLQGQWNVTDTAIQPPYVGIVLIDAAGRVTWDSPADGGRPAKFHGYIAHINDLQVEIIFTDRVVVAHTYCLIHSSDLLGCRNRKGDGSVSGAFALTRVAPGPQRLMPVLP